jgi:antirestriction protein ArdC
LFIPFPLAFKATSLGNPLIPTSGVDIKINVSHNPFIMKASSHTDVYQIITDLIIEKLESGTIPWKQPWSDYGLACNYLSKKPYQGINQLILAGLHSKPFYLTFQQAVSLGGRIKKGAKSIPVTYWNFVYRHKESGKKLSEAEAKSTPAEFLVKTAFLKYYRVFNVDDILDVVFDIPELQPGQHNYTIEKCEAIINEMPNKPEIRHKEYKAYYHPVYDYINMPPIEHFKTSELYFHVLNHEVIHAVGHPKRLNRFEGNEISAFNSANNSKEELIAEIGAAFLSNHGGVLNTDTLEDSAAYIQGWLRQLKNDKKFIVEASAKAQKAVDYILGKETA